MRADMHKVICEEPRGGRQWARQFPRPKIPFEELPKAQGIKRPHAMQKWFGEHLGPLKRWVRSNVGRPWNDVYSEACQVIKPDSVVRAHIKFHLLDMIERHTFLQDGEVWYYNGNIPRRILALRGSSCWPKFYVHPVTGILREVPMRRAERWRDKPAEHRAATQHWLTSNRLLRMHNGLWFECELAAFPDRFAKGESPWRHDLAERRLICRSQAYDIYGKPVFCVAKRQLSRRELKQYGLANVIQTDRTQSSESATAAF